MKRKFTVNNFNETLPPYVQNNEISISTRLIAKHYLDEQAVHYNWIETAIENFRFFNRLSSSSFFKYKPQYKPPYTESKKGFSNTLARAVAKAFLDKYEKLYFFDDFDSYYKNSSKTKYSFGHLNIVTKKINKSERGPDLICKDSNKEFAIVECKGRLTQYSEKDLKEFIKQSNNAEVADSSGIKYKTKHFAVPCYVSFNNDNSTISIVDPPNDGQSAENDSLNLIERNHYSRVLNNLGFNELGQQLLHKPNSESNLKFDIAVVTSSIDNKRYVVPDFPNYVFPFFNQFIYCLDLSRFELLKQIIQNPQMDFQTMYQEKLDNNENQYLSNDGSFLISRNEILNFERIEI